VDDLVVVLRDTGQLREGLPVFVAYDQPAQVLEALPCWKVMPYATAKSESSPWTGLVGRHLY